MIVVAIVAILAAVALPAYRDYILRGQVTDGTNLLSAAQANMERFFQDNRTYASVGTIYTPCDTNIPVAQRTSSNRLFVLTCSGAPTATFYTIQVVGSGPVNGLTYTVTSTGVQATPFGGTPAFPTSATCWVVKPGQSC